MFLFSAVKEVEKVSNVEWEKCDEASEAEARMSLEGLSRQLFQYNKQGPSEIPKFV